MKKKTEIIILLKKKESESIVDYRDVYYYIPADQQKTVFSY